MKRKEILYCPNSSRDTLHNVLEELGISRVDLTKIDAEGDGPQILTGSRKTLKDPRIIFES